MHTRRQNELDFLRSGAIDFHERSCKARNLTFATCLSSARASLLRSRLMAPDSVSTSL